MLHAVTEDAHHMFATLSGDFNPQHMDATIARRLFFGSRVVHGVHTLMRVLEVLVAQHEDLHALAELRVTFSGPVRIGDTLSLVTSRSADTIKAAVSHDGQSVMRLTVKPGTCHAPLPPASTEPPRCLERGEAELTGLSGEVPIGLDPSLFARLFPALATGFDPGQAALLLACTRLVGMECPGLHSIYKGMKLTFGAAATGSLRYTVRDWQPRFRHLTMAVEGGGSQGLIECFLRPPSVEQAGVNEVRQNVASGEFTGQRALIVGGSRGLGEVTAKVIAAGGGTVVLTYHDGQSDGERVTQELTHMGCDAACLPLSVLDPNLPSAPPPGGITHVYYFASPHIGKGAQQGLDAALLRHFCDYYCDGLVRTMTALAPLLAERVTLVYPSTIFIQAPESGFAEYATAKAAGEAVAQGLAASLPGCRVVISRLPRLKTDQTQSLTEGGALAAAPLPVIAELVRSAV